MKSISRSTPDRLLTPEEVCDRLGVSSRWLKRALEEQRIQPTKMGRLNRFPESLVERLVRDGVPIEE